MTPVDRAAPHPSCLICANPETERVFAGPADKWSDAIGWNHGAVYWYCSQCAGLTQFPRMDAADYRRFYEERQRTAAVGYSDDGVPAAHLARKAADAVLKWKIFDACGLTGRLPAGAAVFEIGPAEGTLLASFRERGFSVSGIEPLAKYASFARDHYGLDVATGYFDSRFLPQRPPALVVIDNVLEHLPEPSQILATVRSVLMRDGLLLVLVPNAETPAIGNANIAHFSLWSRRSLEVALNRAGFELIGTLPGRPLAQPHEWVALARVRGEGVSAMPATQPGPSLDLVRSRWRRAIRIHAGKQRVRRILGPVFPVVSSVLRKLRPRVTSG
jgi:SAM-dependent methyltransferase